MLLPPTGFCSSVHPVNVPRGDTLILRPAGCSEHWTVLLIGTWCPEPDTPHGRRACDFARDVMEEADGDLFLWLPCPMTVIRRRPKEKMPGHLYVGTEHTLNEMLVVAGYASRQDPNR